MGVAGAGKSTVGAALAQALGWGFFDGDDFHPPANVRKMAAGAALTDADRSPWLDRLQKLIAGCFAEGESLVLACSALKETYRRALRGDFQTVRFVYLKGDYELMQSRLAARRGHYMNPSLLQSQFETLEEPQDAITVNAAMDLERIIAAVTAELLA